MATQDSLSSKQKTDPSMSAAGDSSQPLTKQDKTDGEALAIDVSGTVYRPRVAILISEGFDGESAATIYECLVEVGAVPVYVSTHIGSVTSVQGTPSQAEVALEQTPPILFEGLVVPGGKDHVLALCERAEALDFVREQHRLTRPILALQDGAALIEKAGLPAPVNPEPAEPSLFIAMHATAEDALPDFLTAMTNRTSRESTRAT